jgi:hypothetical protein
MNSASTAARRIALLLLSATLFSIGACKTMTPQPPKPLTPNWQTVPAGVMSALCERLRIDAVAHEGDLAVVRTTQPIVSAGAIAGLARRNMKSDNMVKLAEDLSATQKTLPLMIPRNGCAWKPIDYFDHEKQRDMMVVELSSPIRNPFARGEAGLFARISLGGMNSTWYWIPLRYSNSAADWMLDRVAPLGVWE